MTVNEEGKYEITMLCQEQKKLIHKQLQYTTQEVQYAEATIEERSRLEKEI